MSETVFKQNFLTQSSLLCNAKEISECKDIFNKLQSISNYVIISITTLVLNSILGPSQIGTITFRAFHS